MNLCDITANTEREHLLVDLIEKLPCETSGIIPNEREKCIKAILLISRENQCVEETIKLAENNAGVDLNKILQLMFSMGIVKTVEIVDADGDEDAD